MNLLTGASLLALAKSIYYSFKKQLMIKQLMNSASVGYQELSRSRRVLSTLAFGFGG